MKNPALRAERPAGQAGQAGQVSPDHLSPDDAALLSQASRGNGLALDALYDRYAPNVQAFALRILADPNEVDGLVHDVFLELWHKAGSEEPARCGVRNWLLLRVRSMALKAESRAQPSTSLTGAVAKEMSAEQRRIFELTYLEGLSCAEIAAHLQASEDMVRRWLLGAVSQLKTSGRS